MAPANELSARGSRHFLKMASVGVVVPRPLCPYSRRGHLRAKGSERWTNACPEAKSSGTFVSCLVYSFDKGSTSTIA